MDLLIHLIATNARTKSKQNTRYIFYLKCTIYV